MSIGFVLAGSTSISRLFFLEHATTGAVTGLTYSGVTFAYSIDGADWTTIDPVDGHLTNFVSDGFKEATGTGGWYRVGLRNALFTSAAKSLKFKITRDSDSAELFIGECIVNAFDLTDADPDVNLVKWKGTAPASLVDTDKVPSSVQHMAANVVNASAVATDAAQELAAMIETYIVNEGDATAVLQAVADKIAADWIAGDASPLAIASAVWAAATRTLTANPGLTAADMRTALGMATANLDTQLGDIPTNSELATALAAADDAVLSAIAALNNLSQAQAQAAAEAAIVAKKLPRHGVAHHYDNGEGDTADVTITEV